MVARRNATDTRAIILMHMRRAAHDGLIAVSCRRMGDLAGVGHETARRHIKALVADGAISVAGAGRRGNPFYSTTMYRVESE